MAEETTTQKQTGKERQAALLVSALERASQQDGVLLNGTMKQTPRFYDKNLRVSPVNALVMAIHSDMGNYRTNSYVLFNETKSRGEAVRKGEKGVPFTWKNAGEYVSKENPEDKISRADFKQLSDADQARYKPNPREDTYVLFNIDQTTMPHVHKDEYEQHVSHYGGVEPDSRQASYKDKRIAVNEFILRMRDNLVPIRRDPTGIAHYDGKRDTVYIPAQKDFPSYRDYVQEVARQVAHATGTTGRLSRDGAAEQKEMLVEELASAVKMLDLGMPAKLRPETMKELPAIIEQMKENPQFAQEVMHDVNRTVGMIKKAESGEKIQILENPAEKRQQEWAAQFPIEHAPEKFNAVVMLKDDDGKWTLAFKSENTPVIAVHPSKEDVSMYFDVIKNDHDETHVQEFRTQMAQKYYSLFATNQTPAVNLFRSDASQEALDMISKVNAFKTKDSKILLVATIGDEKQKPKLVSQEQWQRLWLADDKQDYKTHLAATLYADVLAGKLEEMKHSTSPKVDGTLLHEEQEQRDNQQQTVQNETAKKQEEEKRRNSPEQKEKERREEKAKEEATKAETKVAAAIALSPMMKQFVDLKAKHPDAMLLFRVGDFYETYQQDARKASQILGITLTKSNKHNGPDGKPAEMAGFPHHALDTYLPKLIRAGERVAICDQLENPRTRQNSQAEKDEQPKQAVKEMVVAGTKMQEEQHRGMHR